MLNVVSQFFKVLFFFISLWREKDKERSEEKKKVATKVVDAFKQTDKDERASRLNAAVAAIKRL